MNNKIDDSRDLDRPSRPEDDTATDEEKGKPLRGPEDIDSPDHDPKEKHPGERSTGHTGTGPEKVDE
ncbi:hypothetical protein [Wenxinia marina]|uniref:Uncharacterized protein n=1 Tax=Wenxinia marina DSM 24838 TaxID=1123501 RepID=A0A0D0PYY3_9RHOB|nr:hypothetical protein [Wenxinia marina]KIQ67609.1 hypothetical protein Wenmar_04035 [Wenxinia marina DSM 24838]GGL68071.1 hypothetical protein GCM10011392_23220 [Wenxinia marina]